MSPFESIFKTIILRELSTLAWQPEGGHKGVPDQKSPIIALAVPHVLAIVTRSINHAHRLVTQTKTHVWIWRIRLNGMWRKEASYWIKMGVEVGVTFPL